MDIRELQRSWHGLGERDPLWAIITCPEKQGNRWEVGEFFDTGVREIQAVLAYVTTLDVPMPRARALDLGCGVGRLTQALAPHFAEVCGVDIAPSMIERARRMNRYETCRYFLNETDDLRFFGDGSFDFIYTNLVLQHMEPRYSKNYLREFVRLLGPEGLLIFQLPSEAVEAEPKAIPRTLKDGIRPLVPPVVLEWYRMVRRRRPRSSDAAAEPPGPTMEMYGVPRDEVAGVVGDNGARVLDIVRDDAAGPGWISYRYCVTK